MSVLDKMAAYGELNFHLTNKKFGRNHEVGTSFEPISMGGTFATPTALTTLRIRSSDVDDTSAGDGARTVRVTGLGAGYEEVSEDVTMNGTTNVTLSTQFYRVYRMFVLTSGTYATAVAGSHQGDIILENSAGTVEWGRIDSAEFPKGQSEIAIITVPTGMTMFINDFIITVDSSKASHVLMFQRQNIDNISAPFDPMRLVVNFQGLKEPFVYHSDIPFVFPEKTDIGFMAHVDSTTASVSIEFSYDCIETSYLDSLDNGPISHKFYNQ